MIMTAIRPSYDALNFGMSESAVGGAIIQYIKQFNITNINNVTVCSPYLSAAIVSAPLTVLLSKMIGKKIIIFISCFLGVTGSLIQAFFNGLRILLFSRLLLRTRMGLNSANIPILTTEGKLLASMAAALTLWQTFIVFNLYLGSIFNRMVVEFDGSLSWSLMIGSSVVVPFVTGIVIFFPQSHHDVYL